MSETSYTDYPICPHCGYMMRDHWELDFGSDDLTETDCGECEKPMEIIRHVSVTYTTKAVSEERP